MRVFISHASEQRTEADRLAIALRARRDTVFIDVDDLPPAGDYQSRIQRAIQTSDLFCFLISPESISAGRFTLSELNAARRRWPDPTGRVLPIMAVKVPIESVPSYLRAVSILVAQGDLVADSLDAIEALRPRRTWQAPALWAAVTIALMLFASGVYLYFDRHNQPSRQGGAVADRLGDVSASSDAKQALPQREAPAASTPVGSVSLVWNGASSVPWEISDGKGHTIAQGIATARSMSRLQAPPGNVIVTIKGLPELPPQNVDVIAGQTATLMPAIGQLEVSWSGPTAITASLVDQSGAILRQSWSIPARGSSVVDLGAGRYSLLLPNRRPQAVTVAAGSTASVTVEPVAPVNRSPPPRPAAPPYVAGQWRLPATEPMGFVEIPSGVFPMGSDRAKDRSALQNEQPQQQVNVASFFIGRYEVTVDQYKVCVDEGVCKPANAAAVRDAAYMPVRHVSWYEAMAYCEWLDAKLQSTAGTPVRLAQALHGARDGRQWQVRLPTEAEWEKAARGTDGRIYPWGNLGDASNANYEPARINGPSPVGRFPGGASAYGLFDMGGNVWEWTRSRYILYPYVAGDGREDTRPAKDAKKDVRVIRGGSFQTADVRAARRNWSEASERTDFTGFRVALGPPLPLPVTR